MNTWIRTPNGRLIDVAGCSIALVELSDGTFEVSALSMENPHEDELTFTLSVHPTWEEAQKALDLFADRLQPYQWTTKEPAF